MNTLSIAVFVLALSASPALAQSFNIDWGSPQTIPNSSYAAAGLPGTWNSFSAMANGQQFPLVGLDGQPIGVTIFQVGFNFTESFANPATGDHGNLLNDCLTSLNSPLDGCLFIDNVEPGEYQVIMYGLAPDNPNLLSRLRIDQNAEAPVLVGGTWSGAHQEGVTYMSQLATVGADGNLDVHSGLISSGARSVLNGMQVIQLSDCPADLTGEGDLNFLDVSAFLAAFGNQDPVADFTGEGDFNFLDVSAFLSAFGDGCP